MIKLTEDEKVILRNIDKKYKWIARDSTINLMVYVMRPKKGDFEWHAGSIFDYEVVIIFNHLFKFIKWEDEKPYRIKDLLEGETEK